MRSNRQEVQRVREPQLHEWHQPFGAVSREPSATRPQSAATPAIGWASHLHQRLAQWFATRSEPRITASVDPSGQTWWRAYNPRTQELKWLASEGEVMQWLDIQPCC